MPRSLLLNPPLSVLLRSPRASLCALGACLLFGAALAPAAPAPAAAAERPVFRLRAGNAETPHAGGWVLALDEVAQTGAEGATRFSRIDPAESPAALQHWIETHREAGEASPAMVVYESSVGRGEDARGLLSPDLVLELAPGTDARALAAGIGARYDGELPYAPGSHRFHLASGYAALTAAGDLRGTPGVQAVRPQIARLRVRTALPDDPLFAQQWHLRNTGQNESPEGLDLNVEGAWDTVRGRGVVIGIVDDGALESHPDLAPNFDHALGYDFRDGDNDPSPDLVTPDAQEPENGPREDAHGTLVAGIAAARGFNGIGGTGVAPEATLANLRLIGDYLTDLQEAEAIAHRQDVIAVKNNSWGPRDNGAALAGPDGLARAALETATREGRGGRGTIFVWAAGNGGREDDNANKNGYANSIYTIAVGALNDRGKRAEYSEIGANLLVTAPVGHRRGHGSLTSDLPGDDGLNIAGYQNDLSDPSYTNNFFGTSASTPMVSGVAALMLEANPNLGWRDVQEILVRTAVQVDPVAPSWFTNAAGFPFSDEYGAGLVDATAAVTLARSWTNLGPLRSTARNLDLEDLEGLPDAGEPAWERSFDFSAVDLRVEQVTVSVFVDHPARGELRFELESPSGTVSRLVTPNDDDSRGYLDWTFSSVQFWGESAQGQWKLRIADDTAEQVGKLWQATVTVFGTETGTAQIPATPRQLTATGATGNSIALDWSDVATNETGYRVEFSPGWGNLWVEMATLPANSTHYEALSIPQGFEIYFRVQAVRNAEASGYSNVASSQTLDGARTVLFETGFEASEGYPANTGLAGRDAWEPYPDSFLYPANGATADTFTAFGSSGHGQQGYIGKSAPGGDNFLTLYQPVVADTLPGMSVKLTCLVAFTPSGNSNQSGFSVSVYNQQGYALAEVIFDNAYRQVLYRSVASGNPTATPVSFARNKVYALEMTLNLHANTWSAKLGTQTIVSNGTLRGSQTLYDLDLGGIGASWYLFSEVLPGTDMLLLDDLKVEQIVTVAPSAPNGFIARAVSDSAIYLTWDENLLADSYELQRSADGLSGWTLLATIEEDTVFYLDKGLAPATRYYYRLRARSTIGSSPYTSVQSTQTYTEYEAWKDGERIDLDAWDKSDEDKDGIPLLLEYALDLSPRHDSRGGLPYLDYEDGKLTLRYFRARSDLTYEVQTSTDMENWTTAGIVQEADQLGLIITAELPVSDPTERYLRLVVRLK